VHDEHFAILSSMSSPPQFLALSSSDGLGWQNGEIALPKPISGGQAVLGSCVVG
jgi:hypothetical protein